MLVFLQCVCVGGGVWGVCGWVCVCRSGMLICFVSALGSHEMGHHKLPIIIIVFGKNAGEWTGRVQITKEEIPGGKRSIHGYILTYSRLERENV